MTDSNNDGKARVLQATSIVELIGQTVKLKRRGNKYLGLCPFHSEKTPSFTVDQTKQFFYCFGCKASGNAIDFVIKRDRIEFIEALQQLAQQANIELPRLGVNKQNISERQVLLDAHSAACAFFEKSLAHSQIGEAARQYLTGRGFNAETIKKFQIGLAHDSWDALLKSQAMKRLSPQHMAMAGLVKPRENGEGYYDTFRNRIIFPIRDEQGRIIAFGGRVVPGSQDPAKYLNSPETPLFSKGRCMYGLDLAKQKIVEQKSVAVVEGYTDVVMAHQYGVANVVSVLGTAMTEQHIAMLRRYADRIVLLFDADTAGDLAVNRAVELLLTQEVEIAIASMPDGVDPDEFIVTQGAPAFEALLLNAQDVLSYKWRELMREYGSKPDITSRQKSVEQYLQLLAGARGNGQIDPLRWGPILERVSRLIGVPAEELNRRFKMPKRAARRTGPAARESEPEQSVAVNRPVTARDRSERWVLGSILAEPQQWANVQHQVQPADFSDDLRTRLAEIVWTHQRNEGAPAFNELLGLLDDPAMKDLAVSLVDEVEALNDLSQVLKDALNNMKSARQRQEHDRIVLDMKKTGGGDQSEADEIASLRALQQQRTQHTDLRRGAS